MIGKLVIGSAFLGFGGYLGYTMMNYDPAVVAYSKAQIQQQLASARLEIPRRDGDGVITIWGAGQIPDGVKMAMRYADDAPQIDCRAIVTELGPNQSRVAANCGGGDTGSAMARTSDESQAAMFDEFIQSQLLGREFNRDRVTSKQISASMRNMGAMQREALQMDANMRREQARSQREAARSSYNEPSGGDSYEGTDPSL